MIVAVGPVLLLILEIEKRLIGTRYSGRAANRTPAGKGRP
jgi:hypothetical protein